MLRNNTYKQNIEKITNGNYSDEFVDLGNEIIRLTTLRDYNTKMSSLNLALMEIELYQRVREDARKCGLSDKDVNSWIIDEAVDTDKYHDIFTIKYSLTRGFVKLIRCNNLLPLPTSDNIITNFIHEDCYEELVEMLGKLYVFNVSL